LLATAARAVHYAHQRGILHRDLKLANVLLDRDDQPHVTDFGLAKRVEGGSNLTQSGAIVGTPSYMAPEQARAEKGLSTAVDTYSLGAILYELLTGQPPFRAATPLETVLQILDREPVPPSKLDPRVDRDLQTICMKCLEKDPKRRYGSAEALADDLERWLCGEPIRARPVSRLERAGKWVKRNPAIAALLAAVALVTVLGVAGMYWKYREAEEQRVFAEQKADDEANANAAAQLAQQQAQEEAARVQKEKEKTQHALEQVTAEKKNTEKALTKSEWLVYAGNIARAQQAWNDGRVADAWDFLDACRWDFRGWEHDYLYTRFIKNQTTFRGHAGAVTSVAWSRDDKRIVSGSGDGTLKVWNAATGQETFTLKGHTRGVTSVACSEDPAAPVCCSSAASLRLKDITFPSDEHQGRHRFSIGVQEIALPIDHPVEVRSRCQPSIGPHRRRIQERLVLIEVRGRGCGNDYRPWHGPLQDF
jgi:hypothetical protein